MAGKKPDINVVVKGKESSRTMTLIAYWQNENGLFSGKMSNDVAKIVLTNGQVITPDACFFNLYDNREEKKEEKPQSTSNAAYEGGDDNDDIPF